jgi:hypothetical protein
LDAVREHVKRDWLDAQRRHMKEQMFKKLLERYEVVIDDKALRQRAIARSAAHSITLGMATFGYANLPVPPLNAAIALSILFLGPEIVRSWRGETSITIQRPWLVAFHSVCCTASASPAV